MPRRSLIISLLILANAAFFLIQLPDHVILNEGTDSYETHHRLGDTEQVTQQLTLSHRTAGFGLLAVDLTRQEQLQPLAITILREGNQPELHTVISPTAIADDTFAWARLPEHQTLSTGETITLVITSADTPLTAPYGIRFNEEDGHLAVGVIESIPLWEHVARWATANPKPARTVMAMVIGGLITMLLGNLSTLTDKKTFIAALGVLALFAIAIRIPIAQQIDSIFGGDAFNYVMKSRAWVEGQDPFAMDPRKAPLLSFLLLPATQFIDPLTLGRGINIVSAAIGVVLLPLLARRLGAPPPLALAAGALLAVNRLWWWESVHSLANIPYTTLIIAALLTYTYAKPYLLGVIAGLATLTRFEGGLIAATLLPSTWLLTPRWQTIWRSLVPFIILISIPLVLWPFTGASGVRTPEDIVDDPGLYIAWDWHDYVNNLDRFRHTAGRLWLFIELVGNQLAALLIGIGLGLGLGSRQYWPQKTRGLPALLLAAGSVAMLVIVAYNSDSLTKNIVLGLTTLTGAGLAYGSYQKPFRMLPIILTILVQVLFVTAILPKERYYLPIVPLAVVGITLGLTSLSQWKRVAERLTALFAIGLIIGLVYSNTTTHLPGLISDYNEKSGQATDLVAAGRYMREHPGIVAAPLAADLFLRTYIPTNRFEILRTNSDAVTEKNKLENSKVTYLVTLDTEPTPASLTAYPTLFTLVATYNTAHIYRFEPTP